MLTDATVREALAEIPYPGMTRDIVALGLVRSVAVQNDRVHVSLVLSTGRAEVPDQLRTAIAERLARAGAIRTEVQIVPPDGLGSPSHHPAADRVRMPGARRVVAVGAGKGGVGKSTIAVNLALALRESGLAVGILDADIYGPSVPVLLGVEDGARRIRMTAEQQIVPLEAQGVSVVSFGFFLGAGSPAVWRGPMVGKAVKQFSRGVIWPDLDVLVVDLPPGTGDVPLSLTEAIEVDGAIVVTTPQRLSVLEAAKAATMFTKLGVPLLGIVENLSHARCSGCDRISHPFGRHGGRGLSEELGAPLLAEVPFDDSTVAEADQGVTILANPAASDAARAVRELAQRVTAALELPLPAAGAATA